MTPRATYRLQFRREFTFDDAVSVVPYLARLGISHVYASPILTARKGSSHGYDVVDHSRINPELGGEEAFRRFVAHLKEYGLGLIVDIVPNHMATGAENAWWMDVLEHGRESVHAPKFDIDWDPPHGSLKNRLLLPILATPLNEALAREEIMIVRDDESGAPRLRYGDHRLPLRPRDAQALAHASMDEFRNPGSVSNLLDRQHYRLAWWRTAGDVINWRRFFDNNDLIALRADDEQTFEAVHAKHLALFAEGLIDGFRIDHADGLADPRAYCRRLRARLSAISPRPAYLVIEKVLAPGEDLPRDWGVDGTTGYDFMNDAAALLHDPAGAHPLADLWAGLSGWTADFDSAERDARRRMLNEMFRGAFHSAVLAFHRLFPPVEHDLTLATLERAMARLLAELRIYRTYVTGEPDSLPPGPLFDAALTRALRRAPENDAAALRLMDAILKGRETTEPARVAVRRFNQLAAPLAAKADEDTAYYRYGRLLSRNEVGSDPGQFALAPDDFQARARSRLAFQSLVATATHDHKRGEDARMRLAVLSEIPDEWATAVAGWFACNAPVRDVQIDRGDEYQLYQTLVATWPFDLAYDNADGLQAYAERIAGWRLKSLREAKLRTSWSDPDQAFEDANLEFVRRLLNPAVSRIFLLELAEFVGRIAPAAVLNSLVQCVLRCTTPGVPDLYQGAEFWDLSLVDPDNRGPVDFAARRVALERNGSPPALCAAWRDGAFKQSVVARLLALRASHPDCFREGDYRPLIVRHARANNVLAFARYATGTAIVVVVPRLCARACIEAARPNPPPSFWGDTIVGIEEEIPWRSVFDNQIVKERSPSCAELFREFPVAVLVAGPG